VRWPIDNRSLGFTLFGRQYPPADVAPSNPPILARSSSLFSAYLAWFGTGWFWRGGCGLVLGLPVSLLALPQLAQAQVIGNRVALLIGNADDSHEHKLQSPANVGELLRPVLTNDLRFDHVHVERNMGAAVMDNTIRAFADRARGADAMVFCFSGQGMKKSANDRRSFLLPIDARTGTDDALDIERQAVAAEAVPVRPSLPWPMAWWFTRVWKHGCSCTSCCA
jgi:hypothetical protein